MGLTRCNFPDYAFEPTGVGNAGATAGASEHVASGGAAQAGSGGAAPLGDAGSAGGSVGGSAAPCVFPSPVTYPNHCFDLKWGDGESGIDCGGGSCAPCAAPSACATDGDCLSEQCQSNKTCAPLIDLSYANGIVDPSTHAIRFKLTLSFAGTTDLPLSQLSIRYYFNHNAVAEPVVPLDTQASFDPGASAMDLTSRVRWLVRRVPLGPLDHDGRKTDSFLEITFDSPLSLSAGAKLELTQDIVAGSSDAAFDQSSHYSFQSSAGANRTITVHRNGKLVWGREPPLRLIPSCAFARGVDVGSDAPVVIANETLDSEANAQLTFSAPSSASANPSSKPTPTVDNDTTRLLSTSRTLHASDTGTWVVPNGHYWAYAWLTSAGGTDTGTLLIQDNPADRFFGAQVSGSSAWALLGPYPVDVGNGTLTLSTTGTVHLAGLKLYRSDAN